MSELEWRGDHGFLKAEPNGVYDANYFKKYEGYAQTPLGGQLNQARLEIVKEYILPSETLCDIGIGSGQFVLARERGARGYDVNPVAIEWLKKRDLWLDPYHTPVHVMTFWDSLEHIEDPTPLLKNCLALAFVSIPIFEDREHVLRSKHFRPDEHYHYFTLPGVERFFKDRGFILVKTSDIESQLGREDIGTFVFMRPN